MKSALAAVLAAGLAVPASAQNWAARIVPIAGPGAAAFDVPALGKVGALKAPVRAFKPAGVGDLFEQAKAFADEVIRVDKELDKAYAAYRKDLSAEGLAALSKLKGERDYYAKVWWAIVEPAKDLPKEDPRVTPVLQALHHYLTPLPGRAEALEKGLAAASKAVEKARDAANAANARLHDDDRKAVEELALHGEGFEKLEAAVAPERRESKEYMGWVRQAYEASAAWAKAVKLHASWSEQEAWVKADYLKNAKLAQALMEKKLGSANK